MKNNYLFTIVIILSVSILFTSCKKDGDNEPAAPKAKTKTELLTASKWKMIGVIVGEADFWSYIRDCDKDNTYKFNTDKTVITDEGVTKCEESDPQTETDNWTFEENETYIKVGDSTNRMKIIELTDTKLVGESIVTESDVETVTKVTYTH